MRGTGLQHVVTSNKARNNSYHVFSNGFSEYSISYSEASLSVSACHSCSSDHNIHISYPSEPIGIRVLDTPLLAISIGRQHWIWICSRYSLHIYKNCNSITLSQSSWDKRYTQMIVRLTWPKSSIVRERTE